MITITLSNQKGGVGKTSTACALALCLVARRKKVLTVDLDPQGNFTFSAGFDDDQIIRTLYDVFKKKTVNERQGAVQESIMHSKFGFDVLTGGLMMAGADMEFTQTGREYMLSEALECFRDQYDYVVIDTPPTLGILTVNAMVASDYVVVPMASDVYSMQGLAQLNNVIETTRRYCNRNLKIAGLLLTRFNERQRIAKVMGGPIKNAAASLGTKVFQNSIRENVALRESQLMRVNIFEESPKEKAAVDYNAFVDELLEDINGK